MSPKQTPKETQMTLLPDQPAAVPRLERLSGGGLVVIRLDGEVLMSFAENDVVQHKYSATLAARNQWASQAQIAKDWGVSRRSVVKWIAQYRRTGLARFASPGRAPEDRDRGDEAWIVHLREQRTGIDEISVTFGISRGSVCEVLYGRRRLAATPELPGWRELDSATAEQQETGLAPELPRETTRPAVAAAEVAVAPASVAEATACHEALVAEEVQTTPAERTRAGRRGRRGRTDCQRRWRSAGSKGGSSGGPSWA